MTIIPGAPTFPSELPPKNFRFRARGHFLGLTPVRAWRFGVQVWAHNIRIYIAHNEYVHITFLINDHTLNCSYIIVLSYVILM